MDRIIAYAAASQYQKADGSAIIAKPIQDIHISVIRVKETNAKRKEAAKATSLSNQCLHKSNLRISLSQGIL